MARDMSDKDIMKMELEQLQKEVNNTRIAVSYLSVLARHHRGRLELYKS